MDPELILVVLVLLIAGPVSMAAGCRTVCLPSDPSARERERRCWRAVWRPLAPAAFIACGLVGWSIAEPEPADEHLTTIVVMAAFPFAVIWGRALLRATWSAWRPARGVAAATVGLVRPAVIISPELRPLLGRDALAAVRAHEEAHATHRDPLRIWCGQLVTDLQWPWPAAETRLRSWRRALEMARDDEARQGGTDGLDLADAILAASRLAMGDMRAAASLLEDESCLRERIERLMAPLCTDLEPPPSLQGRFLVVVGLAGALVAGAAFGDPLVAALLLALA